ncbi:hypothetical protein OHA25_60900 (plasmid) [Nonomuraea sp. NBC_00507]|uniref:hypothetical protein n=1 Tax=Nonomuraea sp. NBC_00507 TaxID=2976002 RepID=UPI002E18F1C7
MIDMEVLIGDATTCRARTTLRFKQAIVILQGEAVSAEHTLPLVSPEPVRVLQA